MAGTIRVGVGGWRYEPWEASFYPPKWPKKKQIDYMLSKMTAVEVNATFYGRQKPATYADWAKAAPDGFRFALKGSRYVTNRRVLGEAGEGVMNFVDQGIVELGDRLGPINWQLAGTKTFDPDDIAAFLTLLPAAHRGVALAHAIEPRHASFDCDAFRALAKAHGVAVVRGEADDYPLIPGEDAGFSYARLQQCRAEEACGYADAELDRIAAETRARAAAGDAYVFFIAGAKERAPAAAQALIARLG